MSTKPPGSLDPGSLPETITQSQNPKPYCKLEAQKSHNRNESLQAPKPPGPSNLRPSFFICSSSTNQ